ncbi:DUF4145 domain-containing protein [Actinomadura madurae]|uniref:DUF4145 domain-containing protein n=1 Tax=Actinomadura madurae TaxID=1993 RepID=UPI0020270191|nr:DUF4145 domain-containing protein [Actinomadura madurae]URN07702.1 DUF4145 domain-containing protein [Actinomadura madurae]
MTSKYVPPCYEAEAFTCPECLVYASHDWFDLSWPFTDGEGRFYKGWKWSLCAHCKILTVWTHEKRIAEALANSGGPDPNPDMPEAVQDIYEEARAVYELSPRSCGALLRLALQVLVDELEPGSGSINKKIGRLVERGLDPTIQKAMDVLRVIGNNSVHPGSIALEEEVDTIPFLFEMLNLIVHHVVSRPRQVEELFNALPDGAREAIRERDSV